MPSVRDVTAAPATLTRRSFPALAGDKFLPAPPVDADQLKLREARWLASIKDSDATAFRSLTAPSFVYLDGDGYVNFNDFVDVLKDLKVESLTTEDVKVLPVNDSSALVTYQIHQKETLKGQVFPPHMFATTMWARQGNDWQAIFHQEVPVNPP